MLNIEIFKDKKIYMVKDDMKNILAIHSSFILSKHTFTIEKENEETNEVVIKSLSGNETRLVKREDLINVQL